MGRRKSAEERGDEQRRYGLARAARSDDDFELLLIDPNQAIRNEAAMNPAASAAILDHFADDRFWSVKMAVAAHPNTSQETLFRLLERDPRRRGVVHHESRRRLESDGVRFDEDGMPVVA